jgi:hypothetical protein
MEEEDMEKEQEEMLEEMMLALTCRSHCSLDVRGSSSAPAAHRRRRRRQRCVAN